uniref:Uncharacterized protein n=2 Tax=Lygus hesperus TaxID=30085 RepID=A0A146LBS6_LYGHE
MKLAVSFAVLALLVVVAYAADPTPAPAPAAFSCTGKDATGKITYKDPSSKKGLSGAWSCMKYHDCKDGKDTVHSCFWLIPLRQYDPQTRSCTWFWNANCDAADKA